MSPMVQLVKSSESAPFVILGQIKLPILKGKQCSESEKSALRRYEYAMNEFVGFGGHISIEDWPL